MGWLDDLVDGTVDVAIGVVAPSVKNVASAGVGATIAVGSGVAWLSLEAVEAIAESDFVDADEDTLDIIAGSKEFAKGSTEAGVTTTAVAVADQTSVLWWDEKSSVVQGLTAAGNTVSGGMQQGFGEIAEEAGADELSSNLFKGAARDREQTDEAFEKMKTNQWYAEMAESFGDEEDGYLDEGGVVWVSDSGGKQFLQDAIFNPIRSAGVRGKSYSDRYMDTDDDNLVSAATDYIFENYTEEAVIAMFGVVVGSALVNAITMGAVSGAVAPLVSASLSTGVMSYGLLQWLLGQGFITDDDVEDDTPPPEDDDDESPDEDEEVIVDDDPVDDDETEDTSTDDSEEEVIIPEEPEAIWAPPHDSESLFAENAYHEVEINY